MRFNNMVDVVGCHAEGEIGNVVVGGIGDVPGDTMLDKRNYLQHHRDDLRKRLLHEPRGNVVRSANVILPSNNPAAAMGYVVMESTEYPVMSGSNTICVATVLLETGMVPMTEPVTALILESPRTAVHLPRRQGHQRQIRQSAGVRLPPRRPHRGAGLRHRDRRRRVGWHGLRSRRRRQRRIRSRTVGSP